MATDTGTWTGRMTEDRAERAAGRREREGVGETEWAQRRSERGEMDKRGEHIRETDAAMSKKRKPGKNRASEMCVKPTGIDLLGM